MTSSRHNLPWFNRSLRRLARSKQRLYNKAKRSGNPRHWDDFRSARQRMHKNLKATRDTYVSDYLGKAIEENPKRFWTYINQLKQENPGVADLKANGKVISEGSAKSELLNKHFASVFTKEDVTNIPVVVNDPAPTMGPLIISTPGVIKQLNLLKQHKACGPDGIPPWFLKEYALELAPMLTDIYQTSIDSGRVPENWKNANVCGVFKKGDKTDPSNYRPISLTCVASKILEHIIHSHIMKHLEQFKILSDLQHGFRAKRSTVTQLILTIHDMAKAIQGNDSMHAAVLDFSKAFDKVPHQRLLKKLQYYGIDGTMLTWFESFLINRLQTVVCDGKSSRPSIVTSGVPQGTVLGPLLFLIYINDLPNDLKCPVRLFADDALLYGIVASPADCDRLQEDLNRLEQWQHRWQMRFNPSKCKIICISTKKIPYQRQYTFCGEILEQVESITYLGVILNTKLKWSDHISSVANKAGKVLGLMRRNLWNCPKPVRVTAYKSIVRPKLEYACVAWDPHYKKDITTLEKIQRRAARFCTQNYNRTDSVTEMLNELGLKSLEKRRMVSRLTFMYKLSRNLVNINTDKYLTLNPETRTRASHPFKYRLITSTKDTFHYSFFPRSIREWNSLPAEIVCLDSVDSFKSNLFKHVNN